MFCLAALLVVNLTLDFLTEPAHVQEDQTRQRSVRVLLLMRLFIASVYIYANCLCAASVAVPDTAHMSRSRGVFVLRAPPQRASWSSFRLRWACGGAVESVHMCRQLSDKEMRNVAFPVSQTFTPSGVSSVELLQGLQCGVRLHTCACMFVCSAACVESVYV